MKRFRFQFSSVLTVRRLREDEALRNVGIAQRALAAAQAERESLAKQLENGFARREALGQSPVGANAIRLEQDFIDGQKRRIIRQDQIVIRAERAVEKAFRTYLSARRQTQMLEKLKERHLFQFKSVTAKKEQRELDDLTVMRRHLGSPSLFQEDDERAQEAGSEGVPQSVKEAV